jgi:hypothetical protein
MTELELEQLTEWRNSLAKISRDMRDALTRRLIFREVQEIVRRNERLWGRFNAWMKANYIAAASLAVRRHVVRDKKSICFDQLLEEFGRRPSLFSRDNFRSYYTRPDLARLADRMFDKFAGSGGNQLSRAVVKTDRTKLRKATEKAERFATKALAHLDRIPPGPTTYGDLDSALDALETLVEKYLQLFGASGKLQPTMVDDWKRVFSEPWILRQPSRRATND